MRTANFTVRFEDFFYPDLYLIAVNLKAGYTVPQTVGGSLVFYVCWADVQRRLD